MRERLHKIKDQVTEKKSKMPSNQGMLPFTTQDDVENKHKKGSRDMIY